MQLDTEDLMRVRMSTTWGPFNEAVLSLSHLLGDGRNGFMGGWRRAAAGSQPVEEVAPLLALTPRSRSMVLDLHTVVGAAPSIGHALERLEAAPADQVGGELGHAETWMVGGGGWARRWRRDLVEGDRGARHELVELIGRYHDSAIEPFWGALRTRLEAERARCGRIMVTEGVEALLGRLHPDIRWRSPYLDAGSGSPGKVEPLGGRSLVLAPSVFCLDRPWILYDTSDETAPWLLVYPVLRDPADAASLWVGDAAPGRPALARLLGTTRARALDAIADGSTLIDGCTTTDLARRLRVAPATASHHASILRDARLVRTDRDGTAVRHHLTALGAALLDGRHSPPQLPD